VALLNRKLNLYSYWSQPPMNIVIGSNFEDLPIGWNVCSKKKHVRRVREEGEALCLLHYKGKGKSWHGESNYKLVTEWDLPKVDM
jgi:lipopolysaccharide biosynthesis glycosyltransferase